METYDKGAMMAFSSYVYTERMKFVSISNLRIRHWILRHSIVC
jgi:hypothetical protein